MFIHKSQSPILFRRLLNGAIGGFVGTVTMTAVMVTGWHLLPVDEKYALPPRQIVGELTERLGIQDRMHEEDLLATTLASHFSYGAFFGSLYTLWDQRIPLPHSMKGMLAGIALWVGSYLGWLPAAGILPPATRHPWRRNLLMIVAHLVWGSTMGMVVKVLGAEKQYLDPS